MSAEKSEHPVTAAGRQHAAFFRQSGWLMVANVAGGALTWGLHFLAKNPERLPPAEYAVFGTLLALTACVPALPLQMVFSQQTAAGLAAGRTRQLAGMIRQAWLWTAIVWVVAAAGIFFFQDRIVERWSLPNLVGLWFTVPVLLMSLWLPMFSGVLQGKQDFFSVGWAVIVGGLSRLVIAALLVLGLRGGSTGMMIGVLAGFTFGAVVVIWQSRDVWAVPSEPFDKRLLVSQVVPLMLGFGAFQFMFSSDTMFSKGYFNEDDMACYVAAGTLSRALLWLVLPLAAVMFPKIVHSTVRSEKSNLQGMVLIGTAALGIAGVISLNVLGPWVVKFVYPAKYVERTIEFLPWYSAAMIPLALANVLINNLLARASFRVVPALIVLAIGYGIALTQFHDTPVMVLRIMGLCNLLLLGTCAFFTWIVKDRSAGPALPAPA